MIQSHQTHGFQCVDLVHCHEYYFSYTRFILSHPPFNDGIFLVSGLGVHYYYSILNISSSHLLPVVVDNADIMA